MTTAAVTTSRRLGRVASAFIAVVAMLGFLPTATARQAAGSPDAVTWSVQPSSSKGPDGRTNFTYQLDPGATVRDVVRVNNLSKQAQVFRVYSSDGINTPDGKFSLLEGDKKPAEAGAWVGLNNRRLKIPAGGHVDLPFVLRVPQKATPGDHAGGIVAALTSVRTDKSGNKVLVENRIGARVYLRVNGELRPAVSVTGMSASFHPGWIPFAGGQLDVKYTIQNTGNMRVGGSQKVAVDGPLGVGLTTINLANLPELLPGQSFTISSSADHVQRAGRIDAEALLDPSVPKAVANDPEPPGVTGVASTWAVPLPELGVLLLVALALVALLRRRTMRRKRADERLGAAVAKARADALAEARSSQA